MKKKITVLGAGMVGRTLAADLAKAYDVTSVDKSKQNLTLVQKAAKVKTIYADLSDAEEIKRVVATADLVLGAVPGFMGFNMLKAVLDAKKNIVDISFFPEDPFRLDLLARQAKVTAIVDCGVAPGMDNIILGYHHKRMKVIRFVCMVGGLPVERRMPWQYKAPFSPIDVIEEYTRPARLVEKGEIVTKPALSETEFVDFEGLGTLEAFNTDGLRTLLNLEIPDMAEKTLRYPGHVDLMKTLRDAGFFSNDEIEVNGAKVKPVDLAGKILFPQWKYEEGEEDFTVMRVIVEGEEKGKQKRYTYDLFDRYNHATKTSSMARTTGYTATAAANLVLNGQYKKRGITSPEMLGEDSNCFSFILGYLKSRGVNYKVKEEML
ncbi:MAG TPA: saccharopine dehydrogenase C-terminal domain-containing protein [Chitinophagales bacterium]|nr:saccharopine dehydrogenase C-terminal domain-containing protein [Chitinophagales bacterium]